MSQMFFNEAILWAAVVWAEQQLSKMGAPLLSRAEFVLCYFLVQSFESTTVLQL